MYPDCREKIQLYNLSIKWGLFSLSSFLLFPEWNKTESSLVWWNFMFMNISVWELVSLICSVLWHSAFLFTFITEDKQLKGSEEFPHLERNRIGHTGGMQVYSGVWEEEKNLGRSLRKPLEKWVHSQWGCCSPASTLSSSYGKELCQLCQGSSFPSASLRALHRTETLSWFVLGFKLIQKVSSKLLVKLTIKSYLYNC